MRKIYKPTWSGGGGNSKASSQHHHHQHRDNLNLLGGVAPEEDHDDPNGGTNSSFETNTSHLSSMNKLPRFSQSEGDPVQFVPAYQEALAPSTDTAPTTSSADETSWDAIANSDSFDNYNRHHPLNSTARKASSVVVTPTSTSRRGGLASRSKLFHCKPQQQQSEDARSVSVVSSSLHSRSVVGGRSAPGNSNNNSRIARLASLFSSRAVTPTNASLSSAAGVPAPSPPASESSSAYVGWPGTQDKRGGTVVVESSYEESSTGANGTSRSAANSSVAAKSYAEEVQEAVDRQVDQWMASDSASETSTPSKVAPKQDPSGHYFLRNTNNDNNNTSGHPKTSPWPMIHARAEPDKVHRMTNAAVHRGVHVSPLDGRIHSIQEVYGREEDSDADGMMIAANNAPDPWEETTSDLSTSYSKTSSAYFNTREVQAIRKGHQITGVRHNRQAATSVMRRFQPPASHSRNHQLSPPSSLTEETLAMKDQLDPPRRTFNASAGFRGLLDKTQDVPNLMDDVESDSTSAASAATSRHSSAYLDNNNNNNNTNFNSYRMKKASRFASTKRERVIMEEDDNDREGADSDVFDGISNNGRRGAVQQVPEEDVLEEGGGILGATSRAEMEKLNLALLGGGLTTIQTTSDDFVNRRTASDFDENLTNSDCDQYGFAKIPAFHEMASAGMSQHDRSVSSQSLLFTTPSERARRILEKHRKPKNCSSDSDSSLFSDHYPTDGRGQNIAGDLNRYYVHPDEMKMVVKKFRKMSRARYPHLDYEDLEREEDATKAFALSEMRSRIMETDIERGLERRGGTTIVDDIVMTPFNRAAMRVRDAVIVAKAWRDGATPQDVINTSLLTRRGERTFYIPRLVMSSSRGASRYTWEEVNWVDDLELSQYRCHSIGPRHLKGVEMFTIGDCQSILLKLCNERCQELRSELNMATASQIEAEELMKEEGETFDGMMSEAEMTYLTSMEEVKTISHKLVLAEKAFTLVKDRIEKLVAKYEALLVRFENETDSIAPSSVFTYESSYYSDDYSFATAEEREKEALARRAQRAELRAELAAREALLAKQQAQLVRAEKEKELNKLKSRLAELQSESSAAITEREHSVVLARAITANSRTGGRMDQTRAVNSGANRISRTKIDDVKQRFRDRSAAKVGRPGSNSSASPAAGSTNSLYRTVGEEMFQHLDFYERSLKAVETPR